MSARVKLFIFTDEKSRTVLAAKRSFEFDYFLRLRGVRVEALIMTGDVSSPRPLVQVYSPESGFKKLAKKPGKQELERLNVLKRKIEVTLLMVTNIQLVKKDIEANFSPRYIEAFPISRRHFRKFWIFMQKEKKLLFSRVQKFMKDYYDNVNSIETVAQVDEYYDQLRLNLNLGVYSAMNRERKGIRVKEH
jgi:hypothetical protein